jgi:glucokinase-like ROK family protein
LQSTVSPKDQYIGIDVGGTKIAASLVDQRGRIMSSIRRPTDVTHPEATLDSIADAANELITNNNISKSEIDAIGFGIPGLVDPDKGIGIASVNLNWKNVPVRSGLEARLGVRCIIDNDVRTGALGEAHFGIGKGQKNLVYLNIGTGISAVILLDNKFFMGVNGLAGEIGHAVLVPDGLLCKCGGRGCFEAVASGPAIAARAHEKIKEGRSSILSSLCQDLSQQLTAEMVFEAAVQNDQVANETLEEIGTLMAYALQYLALAYDHNLIIIGGGVVQGGLPLVKNIWNKLQLLADNSWVFRKVYTKDLVKLSSLGNDAGVLGAAALVALHL